MSNIKAPSLNGDKIFEQYPLSIEVYKKWIGGLANIDALEDQDKLLLAQSLKAVFYYSPRSLYDFFDDKGLKLSITQVGENSWTYHIWEGILSSSLESRIEAEEAGFQLCFENLEKQLVK